jgi:hypothetical protein
MIAAAMTRPNEACPCGSGKKYKRCCERTRGHEASGQAAGGARSASAPPALWRQVVSYSHQERLLHNFQAAWKLFWDARLHVLAVDRIPRAWLDRFTQWYVLDYRVSEMRRTPLQLFTQAAQHTLTSTDRGLIEQWAGSRLSVFLIRPGAPRPLHDVLSDRSLAAGLPDGVPQGLALGRCLEWGGLRLAPGWDLFHRADVGTIKTWIERQLGVYAETYPAARLSDFLKERGYLLNHMWLDLEGVEIAPSLARQSETGMPTPTEAGRRIAAALRTQVVTGSLHDFYVAWLDSPQEAWQGLSARQMQAEPDGRPYVEAALQAIAALEQERAELGLPAFDVDRLRTELEAPRRSRGGVLLPS